MECPLVACCRDTQRRRAPAPHDLHDHWETHKYASSLAPTIEPFRLDGADRGTDGLRLRSPEPTLRTHKWDSLRDARRANVVPGRDPARTSQWPRRPRAGQQRLEVA